jgi:precorrin isomerase
MWAFKQDELRPEMSAVASEVFARSWHFIERDPVLAGHDRETLQQELARRIFEILAGGQHSEWDLLNIANRAIGKVREAMRGQQSQLMDMAS